MYMPSPVTNRDFLVYHDESCEKFDAREAAQGEIQEKSSPNGMVKL